MFHVSQSNRLKRNWLNLKANLICLEKRVNKFILFYFGLVLFKVGLVKLIGSNIKKAHYIFFYLTHFRGKNYENFIIGFGFC